VAGGAVFCYLRRRQDKILDDVDDLLQQYLPLDHANQLAGAKKGTHISALKAATGDTSTTTIVTTGGGSGGVAVADGLPPADVYV
jgi:hypothetical protein